MTLTLISGRLIRVLSQVVDFTDERPERFEHIFLLGVRNSQVRGTLRCESLGA